MNNIYKHEIILRVNDVMYIIYLPRYIMVMGNNDRAQPVCILLADYEPLYYYIGR